MNFFYFFNPIAGCKMSYNRVVAEGGIYERV